MFVPPRAISWSSITSIFNTVDSGSEGKRGDINITTGLLSVTNGAQLQTNTNGQLDEGSVNINTRNTVSFDEVDSNRFLSAAFSDVVSGTVNDPPLTGMVQRGLERKPNIDQLT